MSNHKITYILRLAISAMCREVQQMNSTTQLQLIRNTEVTIKQGPTGTTTEITSRTMIELQLTDAPDFLRILHVDDDDCFLQISKQILEMGGKIKVETATSVEEALESLKHFHYDLIVSDYEMPGKNGLQFLEEIRSLRKNLPFILFTGKAREEIAFKALSLGAFRYLNKNGDTETVYNTLAAYIQQALTPRKVAKSFKTSSDSDPRNLWAIRTSNERKNMKC